MSYESLIYESRGQVAWITLNRPEALNAMNASLLAELPAGMPIGGVPVGHAPASAATVPTPSTENAQ